MFSTEKLTEVQRKMYAAEKLENFRWISKLLAARSSYKLTAKELGAPELHNEIAEVGVYVISLHRPTCSTSRRAIL
jgi:hypothetical protein